MILEISSVSFTYPGCTASALHAIDLSAPPGSCLLILGHNGAGKSTLLKLLNGLLQPTSGSIRVNGLRTSEHPVSVLAGHVAVTFQRAADQIFRHTVIDEVQYGPHNLRRADPDRSAAHALELFGLLAHRTTHPYDLHPSYRKLLTLASAVAMETPVLAFDEPTAGLSYGQRRTALTAFQQLRDRGRTLVVATHDVETLLPLATQVLVLNKGGVMVAGPPQELRLYQTQVRAAGVRFSWPQRVIEMLERGTTEESA